MGSARRISWAFGIVGVMAVFIVVGLALTDRQASASVTQAGVSGSTASTTSTGTWAPTNTGTPATSTRTAFPTCPSMTPTRTGTPVPGCHPIEVTRLSENFNSGTLGAFTSTVVLTNTGGWTPEVIAVMCFVNYAAFAPDPPSVSDQRLTLLAPLGIPSYAQSARLTFTNEFYFEQVGGTYKDGAVLELSSDSGTTWFDGGPYIYIGGYNGMITRTGETCDGITPPFTHGQSAWVGTIGGTVYVNLQQFIGGSVMFRIRVGSDCSGGAAGALIDNVLVTITQLSFGCTSTPTMIASTTATGTPSPTRSVTPSPTGGCTRARAKGNRGTLEETPCMPPPSSTPTRTSTYTPTYTPTIFTPTFGPTVGSCVEPGQPAEGGKGPVARTPSMCTPTRTQTPTNTPTSIPTIGEPTHGGCVEPGRPVLGGGDGPDQRTPSICTPTRTRTPTGTPTATPKPMASRTAGCVDEPIEVNGVLIVETPCMPTPTYTPTFVSTSTSTPTGTTCPVGFSDVQEGHTFYESVRCLACRSIVAGYSDGTFRPNENVTRGQISKMVVLSAGWNDPVSGQSFEDVEEGSTFWSYVERLVTHGAMSGYQCGNPEPCVPPGNRPYFRPGNNASRGQLVKIAVGSAGWNDPVPESQQSFEDVVPGSTFWEYVERAMMHGPAPIMQGYACGGPGEPCVAPGNRAYFRPSSPVTRGQAAKIVANTFYPSCSTPRLR